MADFTQIAEYLKKFSTIRQPQKVLKQKFLQYVQKVTGIVLLEKELEIRNTTVFIKTDPSTKNEIFYQKNKLKDFDKETPGLKEISFK